MNKDADENELPFHKRLKQNLFSLIEKILDNSDISFLFFIIAKLLELLILLSFSFHDQVHFLQEIEVAFAWKPSELYTNFLKWFNIVRLAYIGAETTSVLVVVFFFVCFGLTLLCWLLLVFGVHFAAAKSVPAVVASTLRFIMIIYPSIIFLEAFEMTLQMFNCTEVPGKGSVVAMTESRDKKLYCWDAFHIVCVCIAAVSAILQLALGAVFVMLDLEMKMKSKNCMARGTNVLEVFGVLQKTGMVLAVVIFGRKFYEAVGFVLLVLSATKLLLTLLLEPYHNRKSQILIIVGSSIEFWVNLSLGVDLFLKRLEFSMNAMLALVGSPLFAVIMVYLWLERSVSMMQLKSKNATAYELYLKMRKLIEVYENAESSENSVWLNGLLSQHIHRCKKETCQLHEAFNRIITTGATQNQDNAKVYRNYLSMKYKKIIRTYPQNIFVKIAYALFLSEYANNSVYALIELGEAQELNPSITEQLLLVRYKSIFERELTERKMVVNKMTQSNVEAAIKFEVLCSNFKKALLNSAISFSELWGYLKNETATFSQLERMIKKIYHSGREVEKIWEDILQVKGDIPKTLHMYAQYQFKVINNPKAAIELDKKARTEEIIQAQAHQENELSLKDMRNIGDYASDGAPCIYVSAVPVSCT